MDSSSKGNPFIGSRISLISKSQMRYEGILYQLDEDQATLALSKVRSFGTEERVVDRPVPARDDLFEYIVFRALDIQDIKLSDAPKPPRTLPGGLSFDPAIVQYSSGASADPHAPSSKLLNPAQLTKPAPTSQHSANTCDSVEGLGQARVGELLSDLVRSRRNTPMIQPSLSFRNEEGTRTASNVSIRPDERDQQRGNSGDREPRFFTERRGSYVRPRSDDYDVPNYMVRGAYRGNAAHNYFRRPGPPFRGNYGNRGGGFGNYRYNWNQNYRGFSNNQRTTQQQLKQFVTDYDFERANNKFERIKATKGKAADKKDEAGPSTTPNPEGQTAEVPDGTKVNGEIEGEHRDKADPDVEKIKKMMESLMCYDKEKSFFDRISCEAEAKYERKDKRKEMAINNQTFGFRPQASYQRMPNANYYYPSRNNYVNYRGGRGGFNSYNGYNEFNGYNGFPYRGGRYGFRGQYRGRTTMTSRMMESRN